MVTTYTAEKALKTFYLGVLSEKLNIGINPFFTKVAKTSSDVWGKDIKRVISNGRDDYMLLTSTLKNLFVDIEISEKAVRASQRNICEMVTVLNHELADSLKEGEFKIDRMFFSDGSKDNELTGIEALFNGSSELYGLQRNEYKQLNPYIKIIRGKFKIQDIQDAIDYIYEIGGQVDCIITSYKLYKRFSQLLKVDGVSLDYLTIEGEYKALSYFGIPVIADKLVADGDMYLLNSADFKLHQLCDWRWLEREDGSVLRRIAGKESYKATLVKYADLICECPMRQAKLIFKDTEENK